MKELKTHTPVTPSALKTGPRRPPKLAFRAPYHFRSRAALGFAGSGPRWWRRSCLLAPTWPGWEGLRGGARGEGRLRPSQPGADWVHKRKVPRSQLWGFNIKMGKKKDLLVCYFISQLSRHVDCKHDLKLKLSGLYKVHQKKTRPSGAS